MTTTDTRTNEELWAALADPRILHRVNQLTRTRADASMNGPGWHALTLDAIRTALDEDPGEPDTPRPAWTRCPCGKIHSPTRIEAERKALHANRESGRFPPMRYYRCPRGAWHWAEKYITVQDCECGHRSYYDPRAASKAAERRNNGNHDNGVNARAFECRHGGHHVVLYPAGERLLQCECGNVAYHSIASADTLLDALDEKNTDAPYDAYRCAQKGRIHIAREDRFPADALYIMEGEA